MIFKCKGCGQSADISEDKLPACGWPVTWHCKKCDTEQSIRRPRGNEHVMPFLGPESDVPNIWARRSIKGISIIFSNN